jgi:hypothetical protein
MTETKNEWVTIHTANNLSQANVIKDFLESHGIVVQLLDEHTGLLYSERSGSVVGIRVQVPSEAVDSANKLLSQIDTTEEAIKSGHIEVKLWMVFAILIIGIIAAPVIIIIVFLINFSQFGFH